MCDGRRVLRLESAEEGGFVVTSPFDPERITRAETLDEAFSGARDAARALARSRKRLRRGARALFRTIFAARA